MAWEVASIPPHFMNFQFFPVIACVCFAVFGRSHADVFVMKSGQQVEGLLLGEDPAGYRVEVKVSAGIKDERVLAKEDVSEVRRSAVANDEFTRISKLVPTPDLLGERDYNRRIREVEKFLNASPAAAQSVQAKEMLETLKFEANEVLAGALKINGKMVSAGDYRLDAYDMDARVAGIRIRRLVDAGDYVRALRAFELHEKNFANSEAHRDLIPLMGRVVSAHVSELEDMLVTLDARLKEREIGLQRMSAIARRDAQLAIADEAAQMATLSKAEADAKAGWLTVDPYSKVSIEQGLAFARKQEGRFAAGGSKNAAEGGRIFRDALRSVRSADRNSPLVTAAIQVAKEAKLPERYIAMLQAEADAKPETEKPE
jgi:hypothetical protein